MSDQVEELIKEIAAKHGVAVSRDDPIFVLQTINQRLMQDSAKAQGEQLATFKSELEALATRWSIDAKDMAERILNAALNASKGSMVKSFDEGAKASAAAMRSEIDSAKSSLTKQIREARRLAIFNVAAACMTLAAAALVLWSSVH